MRACVYVKESARTLLSVSDCGEFVGSHPSVGGRREIAWILERGPPEYSWAMATDWLDFGQDDSAACLGFPTPELGTVMSPLERYSEDSMRFCKTSPAPRATGVKSVLPVRTMRDVPLEEWGQIW